MQNMPSAIMAPCVRLMTSITPQIRLKPIAASPYTAPTSSPSIMEARMPDMFHPPPLSFVAPASCRLLRGHLALAGGGGDVPTTAAGTAALRHSASAGRENNRFLAVQRITVYDRIRNAPSVDRIHQAGALACQWPHNFFYQLAGLVLLPLRQNHGMAYLQAVFVGGGRKLGPPVEGSDIGGVQRLRHLGRVDPARLFDGALQNQPAPVATGGLVAGRRIVFRGIRLGKLGAAGSVLRFKRRLRFPLRRYHDAQRRIAQFHPLRAVWRHQQRQHLQRNFMAGELPGQGRSVSVVAASQKHGRLGRNRLVDDGAEVGGVGSIGFTERYIEPELLCIGLGGGHHCYRKRRVLVDEGDSRLRVLGLQGVESNLQIFGSGREHLEQVLVAQSVGFWFGRAGGQHDLAVLLRDYGRGGGKRGRVGTEQEVRLVLQDHAAVELLHALGVGFVVVAGELYFVVLASGLDAAGSVNLVAPQFKPAVLLHGIDVQGSGLGDGESDGDRLLSESRDNQKNQNNCE